MMFDKTMSPAEYRAYVLNRRRSLSAYVDAFPEDRDLGSNYGSLSLPYRPSLVQRSSFGSYDGGR